MQALSLHLLVERARGEASSWAPFVRRLPDQASALLDSSGLASPLTTHPCAHAHSPVYRRPGVPNLADQAGLPRIQAEHPLMWTEEQQAWLQGSPMAATLAERLQQVDGVCRLPCPHRPQQATPSRCLARSDL